MSGFKDVLKVTPKLGLVEGLVRLGLDSALLENRRIKGIILMDVGVFLGIDARDVEYAQIDDSQLEDLKKLIDKDGSYKRESCRSDMKDIVVSVAKDENGSIMVCKERWGIRDKRGLKDTIIFTTQIYDNHGIEMKCYEEENWLCETDEPQQPIATLKIERRPGDMCTQTYYLNGRKETALFREYQRHCINGLMDGVMLVNKEAPWNLRREPALKSANYANGRDVHPELLAARIIKLFYQTGISCKDYPQISGKAREILMRLEERISERDREKDQ